MLSLKKLNWSESEKAAQIEVENLTQLDPGCESNSNSQKISINGHNGQGGV